MCEIISTHMGECHELTQLTQRQRELLSLLERGCSNREIAQKMAITEGTVKQHAHRLYQRIGVKNRRQAVSYWLNIL